MDIRTMLWSKPMLLGRVVIGFFLLALVLHIGFGMNPSQAVEYVRHYGYYFTLVSALSFIVYLSWWTMSLRRFGLLRPRYPLLTLGVVTVAVGSCVVFHGATLDYKILMDDYLLAATAKGFHTSGEVSVADFGRAIGGEFTVIQSFVDKRPWFYPFLVSNVHDILGYAPVHAFAVNAVLAVIFLGVVFALGLSLGGYGGAILSVLLWASVPLLQQNATGGGMEMLNLLMIHVVILLSVFYLRRPSAAGEGSLCLAAVLLTYSRYESGLFIGAIIIVIVLGWWRRRHIFLSLPALCAAPLLLAVFVQTRIYASSESSWELGDHVAVPFSFSHFLGNIPHAFSFFWSFDPAIANSLLIGLLAIPCIFGFIYLCVRQFGNTRWRSPAHQAWVIFAMFLAINLIVVLCFHAAQFDKRYVARYSLPAHALIIFSTVSCLAAMRPRRRVWGTSIALTALFILCVTLPKNGQALYSKANFMIAEQHWLEELDAKYFFADSLVIDRFNVSWTLRERAALPPEIALISAERIKAELARGKYAQIILVERLVCSEDTFETELPAEAALLSAFEAKLIHERSFRANELTRIYRLQAPD